MTCLAVTKKQYKSLVESPFCSFDSVEFAELNAHKVDEVKYFIFGDKANHFALVAGLKDRVLKCPFSATFGIFSEIRQNNQISYYYEAIGALIAWCKDNEIEKIIFATPPLFYNQTHITKFQNALFCNGFKVADYDMNFEFCLENTIDYHQTINKNSKRKLKIAYDNNLKFQKTSDLDQVYKIIKTNREEKGFPLWLSQTDISNTAKFIKSDYFLVLYGARAVASAYIQHITQNIVNVVYWGNITEANELCPMNFLAEQVYMYYQSAKQIKYISIGTSTLSSVANVGLCYFKESIGCNASPKLIFTLDLTQQNQSLIATAIIGGGLALIYFSLSFVINNFLFILLLPPYLSFYAIKGTLMKDYDGYNFKKYQELAQDDKLSMYEKIGFPDTYREHSENLIFDDILLKLPLLKEKENLKVLDIGSGCSNLQKYISDFCAKRHNTLFLADSNEMLDLILNKENEIKIAGLFPNETFDEIQEKSGGVDIIICYSVFHYIFVDSNVWYFLDCIMELLNDGGQILIGDIPNISKRKRFFASNNGIKFHQKFMQTDELPKVEFNCIEKGKIDDSLLMSIVLKCQNSGFDAYILPQAKDLPFANRRDDIIIRKP